jgi:hypothetical protein
MGVYQDNFEPSPGIYWHNTPCSALAVSPLNHYWNINPEKMGVYQDKFEPSPGIYWHNAPCSALAFFTPESLLEY